jgi:hypothetical protein
MHRRASPHARPMQLRMPSLSAAGLAVLLPPFASVRVATASQCWSGWSPRVAARPCSGRTVSPSMPGPPSSPHPSCSRNYGRSAAEAWPTTSNWFRWTRSTASGSTTAPCSTIPATRRACGPKSPASPPATWTATSGSWPPAKPSFASGSSGWEPSRSPIGPAWRACCRTLPRSAAGAASTGWSRSMCATRNSGRCSASTRCWWAATRSAPLRSTR